MNKPLGRVREHMEMVFAKRSATFARSKNELQIVRLCKRIQQLQYQYEQKGDRRPNDARYRLSNRPVGTRLSKMIWCSGPFSSSNRADSEIVLSGTLYRIRFLRVC
ncbi:hypothetical protein LOAG_04412 [Loa loa]|uniref:Uncharacterized protein n=1 Tax=Loa loa TaxID=7209 RepID=A0A1S0U2N1_LOALO|nr:hypothetical protein LOAG_04412 [Loa loa]EFO24071.1 hypothetical protein LOAG_04412 [Loa loa]